MHLGSFLEIPLQFSSIASYYYQPLMALASHAIAADYMNAFELLLYGKKI